MIILNYLHRLNFMSCQFNLISGFKRFLIVLNCSSDTDETF
jgi:hypothetical protein